MKNVMLLCMSPLKWISKKNTYSYKVLKKPDRTDKNNNENSTGIKVIINDQECIHQIQGRITNEGPVKYVIDKLNNDYNQRLDRIVMICSKKIKEDPIEENEDAYTEDLKEPFITEHADILQKNESIFHITHKEYFIRIINKFAKGIHSCYKEKEIEFTETYINDFSNEYDVIEAVIDSANEVVKKYEDVNLYIDFNGGPRNVAVLIMGISNLMKLRNVKIKEITYMDFDNNSNISIKNMDALFGCIDLVSGVNEYVSYGRIRILKDYFKSCEDQRIHRILSELEDFSNNMQLCLTDYVMANKERVKNALKSYQANTLASSSYEIMFAFVAEDILRGCHRLLEGNLPEMILWCVEKEFIQQALTFYIELVPSYLWDNKIFCPAVTEEQEYTLWRIDQEYKPDIIPDTYRDFSRHMDDKYYWMHYYLPKNTKQNTAMTVTQKTEYMLSLVTSDINRAVTSIDTDTLRRILTDYYMIHNQRISPRYSTSRLGNAGDLWNYEEMRQKLQRAALRLRNL